MRSKRGPLVSVSQLLTWPESGKTDTSSQLRHPFLAGAPWRGDTTSKNRWIR